MGSECGPPNELVEVGRLGWKAGGMRGRLGQKERRFRGRRFREDLGS